MPSVGSSQHDIGRCKPCAFLHTKGCNSGPSCLFCHLCPPMEKQRRKRMSRQFNSYSSSRGYSSSPQRHFEDGSLKIVAARGSSSQCLSSPAGDPPVFQCPIGSWASPSSLGFGPGSVAGVAQRLTQSSQQHLWKLRDLGASQLASQPQNVLPPSLNKTPQGYIQMPDGSSPFTEATTDDRGRTTGMPHMSKMMYSGVQYRPGSGSMHPDLMLPLGPMAASSRMSTMTPPSSSPADWGQPPELFQHPPHTQLDSYLYQQQDYCYADDGQGHGALDRWMGPAHEYNCSMAHHAESSTDQSLVREEWLTSTFGEMRRKPLNGALEAVTDKSRADDESTTVNESRVDADDDAGSVSSSEVFVEAL